MDAAEDAGDGALTPQAFIPAFGSVAKNTFQIRYLKAFSTDRIAAPMAAAQAYDAVNLIYLAMLQAGSADSSKIKTALEKL